MTRLALACEQALHLGNIVKSRRKKGTREKTRKQAGAASLLARAARLSRPNMRAGSQARLARAYRHLLGLFLNHCFTLANIYCFKEARKLSPEMTRVLRQMFPLSLLCNC